MLMGVNVLTLNLVYFCPKLTYFLKLLALPIMQSLANPQLTDQRVLYLQPRVYFQLELTELVQFDQVVAVLNRKCLRFV